jgi:hypothetical protein
MNINLAQSLLKDLNRRSVNQVLISKLGNKTTYCQQFIEILKSTNIPFNDNSLTETKWRILNLDFSKKTCLNCKKPVKFVSLYKGFRQYCSGTCRSKNRDKETIKGWATSAGRLVRQETFRNRYGVEHQLHIPEVFEKQQNNRYKTYSIFSPSGKEFKVQGYERFVIPMLWREYQEDDLIIQKKNLPKIDYIYQGKIRKYYPDCSILSENIICEIKSTYTIKSETLIPKMKACAEAGYIPKVYLYDNGNISIFSLEDVQNYLSNL